MATTAKKSAKKKKAPAVRRISMAAINRQTPDGIVSEDGWEARLWAFYFCVTRTLDRRGGAQAVAEQPKGARELGEDGKWKDISGQAVLATASVNHETGLPESGSDLMPNHRAVMGWELALEIILPPESFVAGFIYTDDAMGLTDEQKARGGIALAFKPKFMAGPTGSPLAHHTCRKCGAVWQGFADNRRNRCKRCKAEGPGSKYGLRDRRPIVDVRVIDNWSMEEVVAVKNNARLLKRVVHRLAEQGYFNTKPQIDEAAGDLGTKELMLGLDKRTMGFQITESGLEHMTKWAAAHPQYVAMLSSKTEAQKLLDAMACRAELAPEWVKAQARVGNPARVGGKAK